MSYDPNPAVIEMLQERLSRLTSDEFINGLAARITLATLKSEDISIEAIASIIKSAINKGEE